MSGVLQSPICRPGTDRDDLTFQPPAPSCKAYPASFRHPGPNALLFSEALTMICRPEARVISHENRYVFGSGDGGGTAVICDQ